jgi:lysozyme family protein
MLGVYVRGVQRKGDIEMEAPNNEIAELPRYEPLNEKEKLFWWVIGVACVIVLGGIFFAIVVASKIPSLSF